MALATIHLSGDSEKTIEKLREITHLKSKQDVIEKALKMIQHAIDFADEETFENLFNLKK